MRFRRIAIVAIVAWLVPVGARAASEQVPTGPRAVGMGSAFTAIANDASALFWNPAGLVRTDGREFTVASAPGLYGTELSDARLAIVQPIQHRKHVLGADWYHSGFEDPELGFREDRFTLGYAYAPDPRLSIGVGGKYYGRNTSLDGIEQSRGSGFGFDAGAMLSPLPGLTVGVVAQDLLGGELRYDQGGSSEIYPTNVRGAAAYRREKLATLALDIDDRWHLGIESTPILDLLTLRAGVEKDREGAESETWTAGAGVKLKPFSAPIAFSFDYAYVSPPSLPGTSHLGLGITMPWTPPLIRVAEPVWEDPLYESLQRRYALPGQTGGRGGLGLVPLTSTHDTTLAAEVELTIPALGVQTITWQGELRPGRATSIPLSADLGGIRSTQSESRDVDARLRVLYHSGNTERTVEARTRFTLWRSGYLDWNADGGARQAGAFVTTRAPAIDSLGNQVRRISAELPDHPFVTPQLRSAVAAVDALASLGIAYSPDPRGAFALARSTDNPLGVARDWIKYPGETLAARRGDCDDSTVLLAALLENLGVRTQFVDVPPAPGREGHMFLLAETGLGGENHWVDLFPAGRFIGLDGQFWLPLETTALGSGFAVAWSDGAIGWAKLVNTTAPYNVYDVGLAMEEFPPLDVGVPGSAPKLEDSAVHTKVRASVDAVQALQVDRIKSLGGGVGVVTPATLGANVGVRFEFLAGETAAALISIDRLLAADPGGAWLRSNRGTILIAEARYAEGHEEYRAALEAGEDPVTMHNLIALYAAAGDSARSIRLMRHALVRGSNGVSRTLPAPSPQRSAAAPATGSELTARLERHRAAAAAAGPLRASVGKILAPRFEAKETIRVTPDEWKQILQWRVAPNEVR